MQSSPPHRGAWHGPPSPTDDSQYSLNLGALDLDSISDGSNHGDGNIPRPKVERVFSEDIDGPSDFTQNMGRWLRGGSARKAIPKTSHQRSADLSSWENAQGQRLDEGQPTLVAVQNDRDVDVEHTQAISHHTPVGTPPRVSILQQSRNADQFSSEFVPHAVASTPFPAPPPPPQLQHLLQPTVQEYYSELTPARLRSRHPRISHSFQSPMSDALNDSPSKEADHGSDLHSDADSPPQISATRGVGAEDHIRESRLAQELQARCEQLEKFNDTIQHALEEEKRLRNQESLEHESQIAEARQRIQELAKSKDEAFLRNTELQRTTDTLRAQLAQVAEQEQSGLRSAGANRPSSRQEALLDQLQDQLARQASEHDQQMRALRQDLTFAHNSCKDVEETARVYKEELDDLQGEHEAEVKRLTQESQHAREEKAATVELEESLRLANVHITQLQGANRAAQLDLRTAQLQLQSVRNADDAILSRITGERFRAVELATNLQQQLQDLRQRLQDSEAQRDAELAKVRSGHVEDREISERELDVTCTELQARISELNGAILDRDEAQDALQKCRSELDAANAELAHVEAVNAEMDDRVASKLRQREQHWRDKEQHWREKFEEADRERQVMTKALLHQWGRDEVGTQDPQVFAYKYVKGSGLKKSSSLKRSKNSLPAV